MWWGWWKSWPKCRQAYAWHTSCCGPQHAVGTQVAVLIDAPGFNLTLARFAKRAGLSVVYYISPQIWAWRQRRVKRVARYVDKMLTLFPFEVPFYTAAGVDAEYVGHPLLDHLHHLPSTRASRSQPGTRRAGPYCRALTWESPSGTPESSPHHARCLPAHPTASAAACKGSSRWRRLWLWTKSSSA